MSQTCCCDFLKELRTNSVLLTPAPTSQPSPLPPLPIPQTLKTNPTILRGRRGESGTRFHIPSPSMASLAEALQQHLDLPSHQLFDCGGVSERGTSAGRTLGVRTLPHLMPSFCLDRTNVFKVHIISVKYEVFYFDLISFRKWSDFQHFSNIRTGLRTASALSRQDSSASFEDSWLTGSRTAPGSVIFPPLLLWDR